MSFRLFYVVVCDLSFFFSSRRRHTRSKRDWSSDVCSSDLIFPTGHVAGGEDVGEEQDFLIRQVVLHFHRANVCERNARVLGLAAGVSAREVDRKSVV